MRWSHAHADLELNFAYRGSLKYALKDTTVELPDGTLGAFWAAAPHQVIALEPGTRFMWLLIPLTVLLRWNLDTEFMGRVFAGELVLDKPGLDWDADLTRRWLRDLASYEPDLTRTVEIEVEARVRRLAERQHRTVMADRDKSGQSPHVTAMTAFLTAHFREPISAEDVANSAGINRHHAMRLFKKNSGMSIWQYLLRLRVSHAQHMLLTTALPVITVAQESGFASASGFYEIFTRECKVAPAEYRNRASGAAARPEAS